MNMPQKLVYITKHFVRNSEYRSIFFNWLVHRWTGAKDPELVIEAPGGSTFILGGWKNWTEYEFWKKHKIPVADGEVIQAALTKPGSICLDVGANIGIYSLYIAACGADRVYSFEPAKDNFDRLLQNIAKNPALTGRVLPFQKAVSDTHQYLSVYFNAASPGHTKVGIENNSAESCEAISLDEFCRNEAIFCVDLLKIDVEGFEMHVLAGCKELLENRRIEVIFFESYENALIQFGSGRTDQWNYLNSYSYHIFSLSGTRLDILSFCESDDADFVATYRDVYSL